VETVEQLHEIAKLNLLKRCPKGCVVYSITRRVHSSGRTRWISYYSIQEDTPQFLDGYIHNLGLFVRVEPGEGEGLAVHGSGFNHERSVVEALSSALYAEANALKHETL